MKELAITVAVWHTEFRTASWSKRRHKNQGVSGSGRYGTLSDLKQNAVHLVVNNLLQNCTLHWQRTLPLCFSESLDLYCYFGLRIVGEAQWPSPHSGSWSSLHSGLWTHLSVKRQKDNVTGYIKGSKSECIYLTPLPPKTTVQLIFFFLLSTLTWSFIFIPPSQHSITLSRLQLKATLS